MQQKKWNMLLSLISVLLLISLYSCNKNNDTKLPSGGSTPPKKGLIYDGYIYDTIVIGNQIWTTTNARVTHYAGVTSDTIPYLRTGKLWEVNAMITGNVGARTYYGVYKGGDDISEPDSAHSNAVFGALYNFVAASKPNIAPPGWHVPTKADFDALINYVGSNNQAGIDTAGYHLKLDRGKGFQGDVSGKWNWYNNVPEGDNTSGFSAIPGGEINVSGTYVGASREAIFWSTTEDNASNAWCLFLSDKDSKATIKSLPKNSGYSIRFVKNKQ